MDSINERWRYPRFFVNQGRNNGGIHFPRFSPDASDLQLTPEDLHHCKTVLRLKRGDFLVVCDGDGWDYLCRFGESECPEVVEKFQNKAEPSLTVRLLQCLPKSDKMDYIVQKAVELGVSEVVPILSKRCVSRPDGKSAAGKVRRWNKIAYEAAKQSGRGRVPVVCDVVGFGEAVKSNGGKGILFYEGGGERLNRLVDGSERGIDVLIGCEGGFETSEVELARGVGFCVATLGERILRAETASAAALAVVMCLTGN